MVKAVQKMNVTVEWLDEGVLTLPECVNVKTVPDILGLVEKSARTFNVVDFVKVKQADSVALAMLLSWQISAGHPLKLRNLPSQLDTLVDLYDLEGVLQA